MGHYETKPLIYEEFTEKDECACPNGMLEIGLMYYTMLFNIM